MINKLLLLMVDRHSVGVPVASSTNDLLPALARLYTDFVTENVQGIWTRAALCHTASEFLTTKASAIFSESPCCYGSYIERQYMCVHACMCVCVCVCVRACVRACVSEAE